MAGIFGTLFPGIAFRRASQKMALDRLLEHDKTSKRHPYRQMGPQSGDAVVNKARASTRESARWLEENNAIAVSIMESMITSIVGDGTNVEPMVMDKSGKLHKEANKQIRKMYETFMQSPEVTGELCGCAFEAAIVRSWLRDGEVFGQHVSNASNFNYKTPINYAVELIEADLVPFEIIRNENDYTHGIKRNAWGQPTNYLLYKEHPGNTNNYLQLTNRDVKSITADKMFHVKLTKRIGQARGLSLFHAVVDTLLDLDHYEDAERTAARVSACQTMVIKTAAGADVPDNDSGYQIAPNAVLELNPGDDAEMFSSDRPNRNLDAFVMSQIRRAAGGTMSSASTVSRNYLGNYSSQRQELVDQYRFIKRLRKIYYDAALKEIYTRAIKAGIAAKINKFNVSEIDQETLFDVDFRGPAMPWIDPAKESTAAEKDIKTGLRSRKQIIRERGDDPEQVTEELLSDEFTIANQQREEQAAARQADNAENSGKPDEEAKPGERGKVRSIA